MATFISRSPAETRQLGEQWGREVQSGWVIGLSGDLGAGKTELVKGIARGLGATDCVHSPSFSLIHEYGGGRLPFFHLDLYRLNKPEQIVGAGLEEYFCRPKGVAVIEWAERWFGEGRSFEFRVPSFKFKRVNIEVLSERERRISYEDFGA
ncbi:MAG TPA: tRNA (adenosine(37)-N6)-threonylcarbamoyltransferase complex ATPase subunit type 1 TsaE [Candidatus Binatia bacterium]|nr:tRNA (adenosine(37)-N6)-threonylcarbamoyltransferase complex ATPase subunit type 1 TsaE [Candidatus Binatia bacterium]